jgi:hypothetical protein
MEIFAQNFRHVPSVSSAAHEGNARTLEKLDYVATFSRIKRRQKLDGVPCCMM